MSMLQEYVAGRLGVAVGAYNQVSDSLHVYTDLPVWERVKDVSYKPIDFYDEDMLEVQGLSKILQRKILELQDDLALANEQIHLVPNLVTASIPWVKA